MAATAQVNFNGPGGATADRLYFKNDWLITDLAGSPYVGTDGFGGNPAALNNCKSSRIPVLTFAHGQV